MQKLAQTTHVLPWMVNVVVQSLPYLADRATIHKTLEECKGNIDNAVSKLLDAEDISSTSASQGSSSVERDPDSDDDEYCGPKKKQDRRLSRATRTAIKEKERQRKQNLPVRTKDRGLPLTKQLSPLPEPTVDATKFQDTDETEEEDWQNDSPYKDSESTSASTSTSDNSAASKLHLGGVRLKLSQPKKETETPTSPTIKSTVHPAIHDNGMNGRNAKTQHWQPGTKEKHPSQRDKSVMQKAAQKAAAKEKKKIAARIISGHNKTLAKTTLQQGKENSPAIEAHIKVLYI